MTRTITTAAELDALPVKVVLLDEGGWPVWRDPHTGWCASNGTQSIPADLLIADGAPLTVLHDPSAPAPAPSGVPEAAVDAAASAVRKERAFSAAAAFGVPMDDVPQCAEMIARTALTAALPFLTAAPSEVERIARALTETTALTGADALRIVQAAQAMSAPSATREATEDEVTEVVTEALTDAYRAERGMSRHTDLTAHDESVIRDQAAHVVSLADARFTITPQEDR